MSLTCFRPMFQTKKVFFEVSFFNMEFFKFKSLFFSNRVPVLCLPKFMFGQKHILNRQKTASILSQGVEVDLNLERPDSKIQVFQIRLTFPI